LKKKKKKKKKKKEERRKKKEERRRRQKGPYCLELVHEIDERGLNGRLVRGGDQSHTNFNTTQTTYKEKHQRRKRNE